MSIRSYINRLRQFCPGFRRNLYGALSRPDCRFGATAADAGDVCRSLGTLGWHTSGLTMPVGVVAWCSALNRGLSDPVFPSPGHLSGHAGMVLVNRVGQALPLRS